MAKFDARMRGRPDLSHARGGLTLKLPPELVPWLQAALIAVAAAVIYRPALHGGWLWDDNVDISENPVTKSATGLWSIWFKPGAQSDYYPVKASVQWMQWHLWGADTLGYHITNLLLHIAGALLVWRLFQKLGLKLAWLGGLIWAIHPVQVESVAWIAELKNTLSMPFFLLAAIFYLDYDEQGRRRDYQLALGLFLVAMLTKPTMVMFPIVILLHAWWKRGRVAREDLKACAPFLAVSFLIGLVTLVMGVWDKEHHHLEPELIPLGGVFSRTALAGLSLAFYLWKATWPFNLLPIYPQWSVHPPSLWQFLPWPVLGGLLFWFWTKRFTWGRDVLFGFGFFLVMLLPFIGFISATYMRFTWVMDHFLYLPILGLIGLAIGGLERMEKTASPTERHVGIGLLAVLLAAMIAQSRDYAGKFVSHEALWTYTLAHNPDAWLAHYNLGVVLLRKGDSDRAMDEFQKTLALYPYYPDAWNNIGGILLQERRLDDAVGQFQKALQLSPSYTLAGNNLGDAYFLSGRFDEAIVQFQATLKIDPDNAATHCNLGNALLQKGRRDEAIAQYHEALRLNPDFAPAQTSLAQAQAMTRPK